MVYIFFPLILFGLVVWRFRQRYNAEFMRQRQITWPEAKPAFGVGKLRVRKERGEEKKYYVSELDENYHLYTHGQRFTGKRLLPEAVMIKKGEQLAINNALNDKRETLMVKFNPDDPSDNMLSVGHPGLGWSKVLVYALFGVLIPVFMLYSIFAWMTDPSSWWSTIVFQAPIQ